MKTTTFEMISTIDEMNRRLSIIEEKVVDSHSLRNYQNEKQQEKMMKVMITSSVSCGTISNIQLKSPRWDGERM